MYGVVPGANAGMTERNNQAQHNVAGQQMLEAVQNTAVGAIITIDELGIMQTVNPATVRLFGYSSDELVGSNVSMLMPEPHRANHDGYLSHHIASGEKRIIGIGRDVEGLRKSGERFPMHLSVSAFDVDGQRFFAGILHDLTERDTIRGALEAQRSIFETVFDNVPEALIVTDDQDNIALCNAAVGDIFGYDPGDLIGSRISTIYEDANEYERVGALNSQHDLSDKHGPFQASYRCRDGTVFPGQFHSALIRGNDGSASGYLTLVRNIQSELDQQKALANAQRMEAFGQLTGGIAHDFNNLLTVITGNHELLEMRLEDSRNQELLRRANDAALMGSRLTGRLLTFSRRRTFDPVRLNLNEQVMTMADLLRRTIGEHLHFSTMLDAELWDVHADPSEIENAILNLAINARDAMPSHGSLIIETANVEFEPSGHSDDTALDPGSYVRLSISDTGTGMTPEVIERAFEPFFTTKAPGRGTGLGLSTIYGFVRQIGGAATIYSEVGHGTTVNIYLPRCDDSSDRTSNTEDLDVISMGEKESILLVEDNDDVKLVTRQRLEQLGYRVIEASNGKEAIATLETGIEIDAVFSDIVMPGGISGLDLARWMTTNKPDISVLLASGFAADAIAAQNEDLPDVDILRKPYSRKELAQALRRTLAAADSN